jgi:endoglucanase
VIFGEFGNTLGDATFLNTLMTWADAHAVGYLAWTWFAGDASGYSGLTLVTSYNGTPSAYGLVVKTRFAALGLVP